MARTITRLDMPAAQRIIVNVNGLNVNTILNVYFNGTKLPHVKDIGVVNALGGFFTVGRSSVYNNGNVMAAPTTDSNGQASLVLYLQSDYRSLLNNSEAALSEALAMDATAKKVIIVDRASIDSDTLPSNYADIARCIASTTVYKSISKSILAETRTWTGIGQRQGTAYDEASDVNSITTAFEYTKNTTYGF